MEMDITSQKPAEEARDHVLESLSNVEEYLDKLPEPETVKFSASHSSGDAAGLADAVSHGVYIDDMIYDLSDLSTVKEHELAHIRHYEIAFPDRGGLEEEIEDLEDEISELEESMQDWEQASILGKRGIGDEEGHVNSSNYLLLKALGHEDIDSGELKDKIRHIEDLTIDERYRQNKRSHNGQIPRSRYKEMRNDIDEYFVNAVNHEAEQLIEEKAPEELEEFTALCDKVNSKEFEVEAETNARLVEFFEKTGMARKNPYRDELEEDELKYFIGSSIEGARDHYRYGEGIAEHLVESMENFYRLKEVYRQAEIDEPGQEAAKQIVRAGLERLGEM